MADLCLFAHFDKDAIVDDYVLHYLAALKALSFSIVFISTSPLSADEQAKLVGLCDDVILRPNAGLDFGSWALALQRYADAVDGRLLLVNDSVYAPVRDLPGAFARLTAEPADFYGMVESLVLAPHLQSWFLLFENHVVRSPAFRAIFAQRFEAMSKDDVIKAGELGLSAALLAAGFRYTALYRPKDAGRLARTHPFNPPHYLWGQLIDDGFPFLKIELVRDRLDAAAVERLVGTKDHALARFILAHQQRVQLPSRQYRIGDAILMRLIWIDYWSHRHGWRALETVNFVACAALLRLRRVKQNWFAPR
jgi:lipopolysaccharide biosynthesis protein